MRTSVMLAAALVCGLGIAPARAKVAPPTGTITCTISGTLKLNHPLSNTASTKKIKVTGAGAETAAACDASGVTGGKLPITAVALKAKGSLPAGASCTSLVTPQFGPTKIKIKFQGQNPAGKLATVAVANTTLASATFSGPTQALDVVTAAVAKGPFAGQTITLKLGVDDLGTLAGQCAGSGITTIGFGTSNPATLTSP